MYKSYLILINDYLFTLKKNVYFDIFFPFCMSLIIWFLLTRNLLNFDKNFVINLTTVLGILAGFNVTAITILTSTNNNTIDELKEKKTGIIVDGLEVSFFRKLYILISYSILICLITIILNTIGYLIKWEYFIDNDKINVLKMIDIFLILHIFFVNIRNITSLYFLYFNETNLKGN